MRQRCYIGNSQGFWAAHSVSARLIEPHESPPVPEKFWMQFRFFLEGRNNLAIIRQVVEEV